MGTPLAKLLQVYYASCLLRGAGVEKNTTQGLKILREGMAKGFARGWTIHGDCFRYGHGVARNIEKAIRCYSNAVSAGNGERGVRVAHIALAEIYENGEGLARSPSEAAYHYECAAYRMDRIAQCKSIHLRTGTVESNIHRAFYFLTCLREVAVFPYNAGQESCT